MTSSMSFLLCNPGNVIAVVGLKRRGFARAAIAELKAAFREVYFTPGNIRDVAAHQLAVKAYESGMVALRHEVRK